MYKQYLHYLVGALRPRGKGVRLGGLKDMLEMPLDVLHEVCDQHFCFIV